MNVARIISNYKLKKWKKNGLIVGKNLNIERNVFIDSSLPWLIEIGDNVTLAPESLILSHDGSTKKIIGYSKVGYVKIGNNVFVGAKSIILPNTEIGDNVVIGAGSVVTGKIKSNVVIGGNPAKVICSLEDFEKKHRKAFEEKVIYEKDYLRRNITKEKKNEMQNELKNFNGGYII